MVCGFLHCHEKHESHKKTHTVESTGDWEILIFVGEALP
jgi:hypothetical protein